MDRSTQEFASFYGQAPVGLCCFDANLRYLHINDRLAAMNGMPAAEHLGKSISEVIPGVAAGVESQLRHVLETGETIVAGSVVAEAPAHPGRAVSFRHHYYPLKSDAGTVVGVGCVVEDVTEQAQAEAALRESEARLRAVLEGAADGVISIDENGIIESFNRTAERIFGHKEADVIGRNVSLLMPEPDRGAHHIYLQEYLRTGVGKIIGIGREVIGLRKDGTLFPLDLAIGEVRLDSGRHFTATLRDVTERKKLERRLQQAGKLEALGRLAGGIAHDFNNLLLPIIAISTVTKQDLAHDERASKNLDMVLEAAAMGRSLVDKIMAFGRQHPMKRQPTNLAGVIEEAYSLIRPTLPATIDIRVELDSAVGLVLADTTQIHEVIANLVSNAADAIGPRAGVIEVRLEKHVADTDARKVEVPAGPHACVTIKDTGCGMQHAVLDQIFEPFFTTKPVGAGAGLGLAVVHGIVSEHSGTIAVTSEPGCGTTFRIYLPVIRQDTPCEARTTVSG